jgi:hypothetical protein
VGVPRAGARRLREADRRARRRPADAGRIGPGFDIAGSATIIAAMLVLVFTLVEAPNAGWASVRTLGSLAGLVSSVAAYALLQFLEASSGYATLMLPAFLLVGVAFTLTYGPLTMAAADSVPAADPGLVGGLVNTAFQVRPALTLGVVSA